MNPLKYRNRRKHTVLFLAHPRKDIVFFLALWLLFFGFGCLGQVSSIKGNDTENDIKNDKEHDKEHDAGGEKLLWASRASRPEWIYQEAPQEEGYQTFTGLSADYASEKLARNDAVRNAQTRVIEYLGTLAKSKFEEISTSYGSASQVIDPNTAVRNYQNFLAANVVKGARESEAYIEKWKTPSGIAYRSFVLIKIPQKDIHESLTNFAQENKVKSQEAVEAAEATEATEAAGNTSGGAAR